MVRWCAVITFFAMLACGLMLPSDGNHGFFSPKSLSFLAATGSWLLYVLALRSYSHQELMVLACGLITTTLLLLSMLLGVYYDVTPFSSQLGQFKIFLTTLLTVIMALFYIYSGAFSAQALIAGALYASCAYSLFKLTAASLHLLGIVNILTFMRTTGFRLMSMDIHGGMIRLQTSVDIATPFLMLFALQHTPLKLKLPRGFVTTYLVVATIAVILSFSRYLMFISALAYALHWLTLTPLKQLNGFIIALLLIAGVGTAVGGNAIYKVVERRLFSSDNYHSDRTRTLQIEAMDREIIQYPLCGKGLGGYSTDCIRDHQLPYSYEVQWVAFTMQLGILGIFLLLMGMTILGASYLQPPYTCSKLAFGLLYLLWLLSGFTNPFLISLTSGIIYSLFWAAPRCLAPHPHQAPKAAELPSVAKKSR